MNAPANMFPPALADAPNLPDEQPRTASVAAFPAAPKLHDEAAAAATAGTRSGSKAEQAVQFLRRVGKASSAELQQELQIEAVAAYLGNALKSGLLARENGIYTLGPNAGDAPPATDADAGGIPAAPAALPQYTEPKRDKPRNAALRIESALQEPITASISVNGMELSIRRSGAGFIRAGAASLELSSSQMKALRALVELAREG